MASAKQLQCCSGECTSQPRQISMNILLLEVSSGLCGSVFSIWRLESLVLWGCAFDLLALIEGALKNRNPPSAPHYPCGDGNKRCKQLCLQAVVFLVEHATCA